MDGIEYSFGVGDGQVDTWLTPAGLDLDGDGVLDAVALDFDGDGLIDDAMWDSDGDGVADTTVIDVTELDADGGGFANWYTDPVGDGTWSGYRVGGLEVAPAMPEAASAGSVTAPVVVAEPAPAVLVDTNRDGILDTSLTDTDGDGLLDTTTAASVRQLAGDLSQWGGPQC